MAFVYPAVKRLPEITAGGGYLFVGSANSAYDAEDLTYVGAVKEGFEFTPLKEVFEHKSGSPERMIKQEATSLGCTLKVSFLEALSTDQFKMALGLGTASSSVAETVTLTAQKVVLYGNNYAPLPFKNFTLTSIADDATTPNTYTGTDITDNFDLQSSRGLIKIKSTATDITADDDGLTFYLTGTYSAPAKETLSVGVEDTDNYYPLYLRIPKANGKDKIYIIYRAYPQSPETVAFKPGEDRVVGCTFRSSFSPSELNEYDIIDEE